jgi:glycosyltransferase involved in cell wall biosynthesis
MKVAFISRATLFSAPGGDTRQVEMTAKYLRVLGVQVDILLSNTKIRYEDYDLLHFYNITRPTDILHHVKVSHKPFLVSTIFVEHNHVNEDKKGLAYQFVSHLFSPDGLAYIKIIARAILNNEKIVSKRYLLLGHKRAIKWIVDKAACLLPNSESEMRRFSARYNINKKYRVVPNGIDPELVNKQFEKEIEYKNSVICLARFEPLKNQLAVIRCLNNTKYELFLHGKHAPNHKAYYEECRDAAAVNVHIRDYLKGDDLYKVYASSKVHVLASYFETTGLSSLEAAFMGCNIVVTDKGDQRDYFGDDAWYCNPDDEDSIREAIDAAYAAPYNNAFRERILRDFTWQRAAEETLKAYKEVLKD